MKVQAQFPQACRAEEAVSAPAEARATHTPTHAPTPSDGDDYVSTIPIPPPLNELGPRPPRP